MKRLLVCAVFALGIQAQASTTDSKLFLFDGVKTQDNFVLNTEKTHTEYRTEVVNKTCYRQVFDGYRQQCETRYETRCRIEQDCRIVNGTRICEDRQICHNYPRTYCYQVAEYRTEAYTCQETVAVPYSVKDFDVQSTVKVVYGAAPAGLSVNESLALSLVGDQLALSAKNVKSNVLIFVDKQVHENLAGALKTIDATYTLSFMNLADVVGPLSSKPTNFVLSGTETLTWDTKLLTHPELFTVNLVIKKAKALASDPVVADQLLPATAFTLLNAGNTTRFATTLTAAGVTSRDKGTYKVYVKLGANVDVPKLLNPNVLPVALEVKGEGKFKLK